MLGRMSNNRRLTFIVALTSAAIANSDFTSSTQSKLILWLTGDSIETDRVGSVIRWKDTSGQRHDFTRLSSTQTKTSIDKIMERLQWAQTDAVKLAYSSPGIPQKKTGVSFPCGLVSSEWQLSVGMSAFFVLKPAGFSVGDQAAGQRFFGHYPSGAHIITESFTPSTSFCLRQVN